MGRLGIIASFQPTHGSCRGPPLTDVCLGLTLCYT